MASERTFELAITAVVVMVGVFGFAGAEEVPVHAEHPVFQGSVIDGSAFLEVKTDALQVGWLSITPEVLIGDTWQPFDVFDWGDETIVDDLRLMRWGVELGHVRGLFTVGSSPETGAVAFDLSLPPSPEKTYVRFNMTASDEGTATLLLGQISRAKVQAPVQDITTWRIVTNQDAHIHEELWDVSVSMSGIPVWSSSDEGYLSSPVPWRTEAALSTGPVTTASPGNCLLVREYSDLDLDSVGTTYEIHAYDEVTVYREEDCQSSWLLIDSASNSDTNGDAPSGCLSEVCSWVTYKLHVGDRFGATVSPFSASANKQSGSGTMHVSTPGYTQFIIEDGDWAGETESTWDGLDLTQEYTIDASIKAWDGTEQTKYQQIYG